MPTGHEDNAEDLLNISQASRLSGLSISSIRQYSRDGRLSALRTPGGHRRFRREDVEALLKQAS